MTGHAGADQGEGSAAEQRGGRVSGARTIDTITVADAPLVWREVGFDVDDDGRCQIGTVMVRLSPGKFPRGIQGWSMRGLADGDIDGLATESSDAAPRE